MGEVGLFAPGQRLELIDGEIVEMTPIGPSHADVVNRLTRWAFAAGDRAVVSVQNPVRVSDLSDLQPDLTLLRPLGDVYRSQRPGPEDVLLLVEVSDSTARWDRRVKRPLYATGYMRVVQVAAGEVAVPTAFPDLALSIADLLGCGPARFS